MSFFFKHYHQKLCCVSVAWIFFSWIYGRKFSSAIFRSFFISHSFSRTEVLSDSSRSRRFSGRRLATSSIMWSATTISTRPSARSSRWWRSWSWSRNGCPSRGSIDCVFHFNENHRWLLHALRAIITEVFLLNAFVNAIIKAYSTAFV